MNIFVLHLITTQSKCETLNVPLDQRYFRRITSGNAVRIKHASCESPV